MNSRNLLYGFITICLLMGCHGAEPKTIIIQPFSGMPDAEVRVVYERLSKIYPHVERRPQIELPSAAWYPARSRYRADSIIRYLAGRSQTGTLVLGLTNHDISTTKDSIADWGVMGLGFSPGTSCIASDFRLQGGDRADQLFKIAVHELGHNEGLDHCTNPSCFMRDAEGHNYTSQETGFCAKCQALLRARGWRF